MKKLFIVFPHPFDESCFTGGTIAKYIQAGWDVHLLTVTQGEISENDSDTATHNELAPIRTAELIQSCAVLGLTSVQFWAYKGGTIPYQEIGEMEDKIYKYMLKFVPDVVITFEPHGVNHHPDHVRLSDAVTFAYQKYVLGLDKIKKARHVSGSEKRKLLTDFKVRMDECMRLSDEPKLYYACIPESVVTFFQHSKLYPIESFEKPVSGVEDKFITTVIDISKQKTKKIHSLSAYQSHRVVVEPFLSLKNNPLFEHEYFILRMIGYNEVYMGKNDRANNKL